uniref:XAC0095 family protein n=1 Tax=Lysobacter firmicutimachus TaxID=1792846 RepID=UPI003F4DEA69
MRNGRRASSPTIDGYLLPVTAQQALAQTRDQLRLLAQLTEPQGDGGPDVIYLSARALAECFDRFADELDRIAEGISPSGL